MTKKALISVFCTDQTGLIASITGSLFNLGLNLAATSFNVLGSGCEFNAVAEIPEDLTFNEIDEDLRSLDLPNDAQISVTPFLHEPNQTANSHITHKVKVWGGDRPGLIARLCEVFGDYKANIVRMSAERVLEDNAEKYVIRFSVFMTDENEDKCLATISNTAGSLKLDCSWQKL